MAGEEGDVEVAVLDYGYWGGGVAPGRQGIDCCNWSVAVKLLKSSTANDCDRDWSWEVLVETFPTYWRKLPMGKGEGYHHRWLEVPPSLLIEKIFS
jgi:hypothetical protein